MNSQTFILGLTALIFASSALAQTQSDPAPTIAATDDATKAPVAEPVKQPGSKATISEDQENQVLAFVSKHDEPLHGLLRDLRSSRPTEYQKALADLLRATERLAQVKRNRPHAYELEIKRWQAQSKVLRLAAKMATSPDPETRQSLRQAIADRAAADLEILRADREAAAKRLQQLDEQLAAAEAAQAERIEQQFARSLAAAQRARKPRTAAPKKPPGEKVTEKTSETSAKPDAEQENKKDLAPEKTRKSGDTP